MAGDEENLNCSFCGKTQHEVRKLVSAVAANICDERVEICVAVLSDEPETSATRCRLCGRDSIVSESLLVVEQLICSKCVDAMRPFFAEPG